MLLSSLPFTLYSWLLLASAVICLSLAYLAARHRQLPVALWFSWLCVAESIYTAGYAFELSSATLEAAKFWINIEQLGGVYIPALILLMALTYRFNQHPPLGVIMALLMLSSLTLALHLGNEHHHLMFTDMQLLRQNGLTITLLEFGPWYYLHLVYINVSVAIGNLLFFSCLQRAPRHHRRQVLLVLLGSLVPWIGYLLFLMNWFPDGIDLGVFGFVITGPLCAYSLFRYRFADLAPIAREQVFDDMEQAVLVVDASYRIVDFNSQASRLFPELGPASIGQDCRPLLTTLDPELNHAQDRTEHQLRQRGRQYELSCQPLRQANNDLIGYSMMLHDVTERQSLLQQLRQYAEVDELTGIMNRRMILQALEDAVANAWSEGLALSMVLFDVDNFKRINDHQGHQIGDLLLRQLASLLHHQLAGAEKLGRYGGDEFLLILPGYDLSRAHTLADKLNQLLHTQLGITLSLGLTSFEPHDTARVMLRRADLALYRAKSQGRNQSCSAEPLSQDFDDETQPMR